MPSSAAVRIFLLGRFEVWCDERVLPAACWTRRKAAALLQRLALERRLLKDQAIEFLWPEADPIAGANNLYRTLHSLRQTLDAHLQEGASAEMIGFDDGVLYLRASVWVDAEEFMRLSVLALDAPAPQQVGHIERALELYQGELLPDDRYAEWTFVPREELRWRQRELRLAMAAHARDGGDYPAAITELRELLVQDSADEPVHCELMRVYAAAGHRHEALRQYQACRDALADELDAPPTQETEALHAQILQEAVAKPAVPDPTTPALVSKVAERAPPLVGRQRELDCMRSALALARDGQGHVFWLAGETGVGKTRLAAEALRLAAAEGMIALSGAAYEPEGQLPYQPFREAFDRYLVEQQRAHEPNPVALSRRSGDSDGHENRPALFRATAAFLNGAAARSPVLLAVDDAHAADEASLQLLHYLARHVHASPVVLLATYRSDSVTAADAQLNNLRRSLARERLSATLQLEPLDSQATAQFVAQLLGGPAAPSLAQAIFDLTRGNPLFIEELTGALRTADRLVSDTGSWQFRAGVDITGSLPAQLSELIRARIQGLGATVGAALAAATVLGASFRFDELRRVAELPDDALFDALDAALAGQWIEETADGYCFRSPLVRHTLCAGLSRERRAQLSRRAAKARQVEGG
jgi:DNA-binding SARP family transcriptional activator